MVLPMTQMAKHKRVGEFTKPVVSFCVANLLKRLLKRTDKSQCKPLSLSECTKNCSVCRVPLVVEQGASPLEIYLHSNARGTE
jgi:hypothetical protein